jgi:hypothetical protein
MPRRTPHAEREHPPLSRLRWIAGSATLTTLPSRIAMLEPRMVAISVRRFAEGDAIWPAVIDEIAPVNSAPRSDGPARA